MQNISPGLDASIKDDAQSVRAKVVAQWANNRWLENLIVVSTEDSWYQCSLDEQYDKPDVYWRLNDANGSTYAQDHSGYGRNGTYVNVASNSSTPLTGDNTSTSASNVGSGYVFVSSSQACSLNSVNATIEGWFYSSSTSAQGLFANYGGGSEVYVGTNASGQVNMSVTGTVSQSATVITNSIWHHIALTKNGPIWCLYVDGSQVATQTKTVPGGFTIVKVGANSSTSFNGRYTEFVSCSRLKDATEVSIRSQQTTSPISNAFFTAKQLFNGKTSQTFAWCVCDSIDEFGQPIRANGKFYAMDETPQAVEYGFKSYRVASVLSGAEGGALSGNDILIYAKFNVRKANFVNVFQPDYYGGTQQLVSIKYLDGTGQLVNMNTLNPSLLLTGSKTSFVLSSDGSPVDITGILIAVNTTKFQNDSINLEEVEISFEQDISDDVISVDVQKTRDNFDSSVPIGSTAANSASITLANVEKMYNPKNQGSIVAPYITKDVKFDIYLGWEV